LFPHLCVGSLISMWMPMALTMWRMLSVYWTGAIWGHAPLFWVFSFFFIIEHCLCFLGFSVQWSNNEVFYSFTKVLARISSMLFKSLGQV
jgi:hypothetical protein